MKLISILLILFTALSTHAQTTADPEQPQFYLWDLPTGTANAAARKMSKMVVINIVEAGELNPSNPPLKAAQMTRDAIESQVNAGVTDAAHVCIVLGNFGQWVWWDTGVPNSHQVSLVDQADILDNEPAWPNGPLNPPDDAPMLRCMQPWMKNSTSASSGGIYNVTQWMNAYLAAYDALTYTHGGQTTHLPVPARFHFDTEQGVVGCCDLVWTRIMRAVAQDARWTSSSFPVAGTGQTMEQLYQAARTQYGWANQTFFNAVTANATPNDPLNRPYYLWYSKVCQQALDHAMWESGYNIIKNFSGTNTGSWSAVKVGNYGHAATDDAMDTFGWYAQGSANSYAATDTCTRGFTDFQGEGARYERLTQNGVTRVWLTEPGSASGDFSEPFLYPFSPDHYGTPDYTAGYNRKDFYLNAPSTNTRPPVEPWRANLYNNRRWVESALNSSSPLGDWDKLAVWLPVPGQTFTWDTWFPLYTHNYTQTELRHNLAMLRAKRTPEVMLWSNGNVITPDWGILLSVLDQVYRPKLTAYTNLTGTALDSFAPGEDPLDRPRYTLRAAHETLGFSSKLLGPAHTVAVQFTFTGLSAAHDTSLNLEMAVKPDTVGSTLPYGRVYVRNDGDLLWTEATIADWTDAPAHPASGFGFFAPASGDGSFQTRRTFPLPTATTDTFYVKVVLQQYASSPSGPSSFNAYFDLVQLVGTPDINGGTGGGDDSPGGDYDYSRSIDTVDSVAFLTDWLAGENAADLNHDGLIDAQDFMLFQSMLP